MAKSKTKKQSKKKEHHSDDTLKIEGTLDDVLKASVPPIKKPTKK